jgi:hypothetical protein
MDRDKAIDRVRKCLALSKSPNEHEAAAALRQAQKLMQSHGITEEDVGLAMYVSDFVDHKDYEFARRKPMIIVCVCALMTKAFGVQLVWEASPEGKHRTRYFGQKANVMLAVHAHTVVYRAVNAAWKRYLEEKPYVKGVRNARASFVHGWCAQVAEKVEDLSPNGDELANIEKTKAKHYGKELPQAKLGTRSVYTQLQDEGAKAGTSFSINRPVETNRRYLENKS